MKLLAISKRQTLYVKDCALTKSFLAAEISKMEWSIAFIRIRRNIYFFF